jgi:hypothetical protein
LIHDHLPRFKVDAPKVRCRRQELHANSRSPVARFAQIHNPTFLFFLGFRIHQNQHFAVIDFVPEIQQTAVGADHQRLANLAEFAALVAPSECLQAHLMEDALATALSAFSKLYHALIFALPPKPVNCPFGQVFPS